MFAAAALTLVPYFRLVSGQPTPWLGLLLFLPFALVFFGATVGGIFGGRFLLDLRRSPPAPRRTGRSARWSCACADEAGA
jgi:hypothetical protein